MTEQTQTEKLEERIDKLERLYEGIYHDYELLAIYIPKLTDILIKYWGVSGKHREAVLNDIRTIRDAIDEHFKTHYLDKKKKEEYASNRRHKDDINK